MSKFAQLKARRPGDRGFTLVELLVVVVILAALAAIAVPIFMNQKDKAELSANKTNLSEVSRVLGQNVSFSESINASIGKGSTVSSTEGNSSVNTSRALTVKKYFAKDAEGNDTTSVNGFCVEDSTAGGTGKPWKFDSTKGGIQEGAC